MARGENPGALLTIDSVLTYDKDEPFGHANAGKDLVLKVEASGQNAGKANLGTAGAKILGKFVELHPDGTASYMPSASPMILRKEAAAIAGGSSVVCGANGKVRIPVAIASTPTKAQVDENDNARGIVLQVLETGDNGRILVHMP